MKRIEGGADRFNLKRSSSSRITNFKAPRFRKVRKGTELMGAGPRGERPSSSTAAESRSGRLASRISGTGAAFSASYRLACERKKPRVAEGRCKGGRRGAVAFDRRRTVLSFAAVKGRSVEKKSDNRRIRWRAGWAGRGRRRLSPGRRRSLLSEAATENVGSVPN